MKTAAIIPAYNEGQRVTRVLAPLIQSDVIDEIIVVDDGSVDDTADVARRFAESDPPAGSSRIRVIELPENRGKGGAMRWGALNTDAEVILFLDADLIGLQPVHVCSLVTPVVRGELDMTLGVFKGGRGVTDLSHFLVAWISGQRALSRKGFLAMGGISRSRSGVETAITRQARAQGWRVESVVMPGVTHTMKEEKIGWIRGVRARFGMYAEIARSFRDRPALEPEPEPADAYEVRIASEELEGRGASS